MRYAKVDGVWSVVHWGGVPWAEVPNAARRRMLRRNRRRYDAYIADLMQRLERKR